MQIQLGLMDYVMEISGTTGEFDNMPNIILSLKIVTFKGTYGPYGNDSKGTRFSYSVQGSDRITGFFGRSGWHLDAIGLYVRQC